MPPTLRTGSRIIASSTTPMPPAQVTSPRQSSAPRGRSSSPTITVPPVVVIAEVVSKSASVKESPGAPSISGRVLTTVMRGPGEGGEHEALRQAEVGCASRRRRRAPPPRRPGSPAPPRPRRRRRCRRRRRGRARAAPASRGRAPAPATRRCSRQGGCRSSAGSLARPLRGLSSRTPPPLRRGRPGQALRRDRRGRYNLSRLHHRYLCGVREGVAVRGLIGEPVCKIWEFRPGRDGQVGAVHFPGPSCPRMPPL